MSMGNLKTCFEYFKQHPWQRRVVAVILVVIAGSIVGRLTYPLYLWYERRQADIHLIERLGDADAYQREVAVQTAIIVGQDREELIPRLIDALDTPDAGRFASLQYVLERLGKWNQTDIDPKWRDRYRLLEFRATFAPGEQAQSPTAQDVATPTARMRRWLIRQSLLCEQENEYIREILSEALHDPSAGVRESSAPLAARLGDDDALKILLHDPAAKVRAAAALDAGLAGRTMLTDSIRRQLESRINLVGPVMPDDVDQTASVAYALALLDPKGGSELLCHLAVNTADRPALQDRLLLALAVLNDPAAQQTVQDILHAGRWTGRFPSGVALCVAGRMHLPEATAMAMEVLRAAASGKHSVAVSQVLGAVDVIAKSDYPCRQVAYELCRTLWQPDRPALLMRVARLLGVQAARKGQIGKAPSRVACIETLQQAVQYSLAGPGKPVTTPLPSAAAAVALWMLDPADREFSNLDKNDESLDREALLKIVESKTSLFYLREATAVADPVAGDYVAWNIGRSNLPEAVKAGCVFLPAEKENRPEYSPDVRACGAMILALAAKNEQQRRGVVDRISRRLMREEYPGSGSLQCALLMAGQGDQLAKVRMLMEMEDFPAGRALMALLVVGDKTTLDWLLWNTNWNLPVPLEDLPPLLINQVIGDVLQATAPDLPTICPAADDATRLWQARILRHVYGIHRTSMNVGLQR